MQVPSEEGSYIFITQHPLEALEEIKERLYPQRVVTFFEESFKIEHAKAVVQEAYISESSLKYIVLAANEFTNVAQNSLLKIFEEPPRNIRFIIISPTKSNLLPTIRSRMPVIHTKEQKEPKELQISLKYLDLKEVFNFLKEHSRTGKQEAKEILEALFFKATQEEALILNERQLEDFDTAFRLLELNARVQSVFAMVLMGFVKERG